MTLDLTPTGVAGAYVIDTQPRADERGSFTRLYCQEELAEAAPGFRVVQSNLSINRRRGTLRGLHYQEAPHGEAKILRCVRGAVWAVVLDLRQGSRGAHLAVELSAENGRELLVPEGTANGFQTLTDDSHVLYFMSRAYEPGAATGVHYSSCGLEWPLEVTEISARDRALPELVP